MEEGWTYNAVHFQKNDWIVCVRWYNVVPLRENRSDDYKKGDVQWIPHGSMTRVLKYAVVKSELGDIIGSVAYYTNIAENTGI